MFGVTIDVFRGKYGEVRVVHGKDKDLHVYLDKNWLEHIDELESVLNEITDEQIRQAIKAHIEKVKSGLNILNQASKDLEVLLSRVHDEKQRETIRSRFSSFKEGVKGSLTGSSVSNEELEQTLKKCLEEIREVIDVLNQSQGRINIQSYPLDMRLKIIKWLKVSPKDIKAVADEVMRKFLKEFARATRETVDTSKDKKSSEVTLVKVVDGFLKNSLKILKRILKKVRVLMRLGGILKKSLMILEKKSKDLLKILKRSLSQEHSSNSTLA